ncbi:MAG TPA: hypothetical protein VLV25_04050 [Steroidobacteraceae bacterium]|nr:hypothetical protein [Steroidobacteraceae bacterium]
MTPPWPSPLDLSNDPELAALTALDHLLELSVSALLAVHPDLGADDQQQRLTVLTRSIIEEAYHLRDLLKAYRAALARHYRDISF